MWSFMDAACIDFYSLLFEVFPLKPQTNVRKVWLHIQLLMLQSCPIKNA